MIRAATAADVAALVELGREVQQLHRDAAPDRYRDPTAQELAARFDELLADPEQVVLVAEEEGAVVGHVVVRRIETEAHTFAPARRLAHVEQLAVRAGAQRAGHGRALMAAAEALGRRWGSQAVTLDVQAFNGGARDFYQALGYEVATLRMRRVLPSAG
jgi:ribosomal protein S18 acetylase RimI-like enzyme